MLFSGGNYLDLDRTREYLVTCWRPTANSSSARSRRTPTELAGTAGGPENEAGSSGFVFARKLRGDPSRGAWPDEIASSAPRPLGFAFSGRVRIVDRLDLARVEGAVEKVDFVDVAIKETVRDTVVHRAANRHGFGR